MKKFIIMTALLMTCLCVAPFVHAIDFVPQSPPKIYEPEKINGQETKVLPTTTGSYSGVTTATTVLDSIVVPFFNMFSNALIGFAVMFLVVGGLQYVLAHGDEEKIKKSHRSVIWAVLGVLLVIFSYMIVFIINTLIPTS